jgi:hypothetical protein
MVSPLDVSKEDGVDVHEDIAGEYQRHSEFTRVIKSLKHVTELVYRSVLSADGE